jgi:hypothetical protein
MIGFREEAPQGGMRVWRNAAGDVLTLRVQSLGGSFGSSEDETRNLARSIAERAQAGLVEAGRSDDGARAWLIYKKRNVMGYYFTGMLFDFSLFLDRIWTTIAGEHGTTGVREAMVTQELLAAGEMTLDDYETKFSGDPYDPSYAGVERRLLRFLSDDARYDARFPDHPLTKVRALVQALPGAFDPMA